MLDMVSKVLEKFDNEGAIETVEEAGYEHKLTIQR